MIGEKFGSLRRQVNVAVLTGTHNQRVAAPLVDEFRLVHGNGMRGAVVLLGESLFCA